MLNVVPADSCQDALISIASVAVTTQSSTISTESGDTSSSTASFYEGMLEPHTDACWPNITSKEERFVKQIFETCVNGTAKVTSRRAKEFFALLKFTWENSGSNDCNVHLVDLHNRGVSDPEVDNACSFPLDVCQRVPTQAELQMLSEKIQSCVFGRPEAGVLHATLCSVQTGRPCVTTKILGHAFYRDELERDIMYLNEKTPRSAACCRIFDCNQDTGRIKTWPGLYDLKEAGERRGMFQDLTLNDTVCESIQIGPNGEWQLGEPPVGFCVEEHNSNYHWADEREITWIDGGMSCRVVAEAPEAPMTTTEELETATMGAKPPSGWIGFGFILFTVGALVGLGFMGYRHRRKQLEADRALDAERNATELVELNTDRS